MYIRRIKSKNGVCYVLRESKWMDNCWRHRDLINLGENPAQFIQYPGGNGFYFDPELEEALGDQGVNYTSEDLEEAFLPFLKPHIRHIIQSFLGRRRKPGRWSGYSKDGLLKLQDRLHTFDKRRLHYLKCGRVDIGTLEGRPWKFLNVLLGKSRDEIEHTIEGMERVLRPQEIRSYLYTALHLQRYFSGHLTQHHPSALDPEKVDDLFLEEICRLNSDKSFFEGMDVDQANGLHPYLVRYVIWYFDSEFERTDPWAEFMRFSTWSRQFFRKAPSGPSLTTEEACRRLGICPTDWEKMDRKDLLHHYRGRAKDLHPDKGGDHEEFVKMVEAYECLLKRR